MQTLAALPPTPINFGIKHFDTEVQAFLSSSLNQGSHIKAELFNSYNKT